METKLVYRAETPEGRGPFNTVGAWAMGDVAEEAGEVESSDYHQFMPCPYEDGIPWNAPFRDGRCGTESLEDLGKWFTPAMCRLLDERGHRLTIWEVPENRVRCGGIQVVFDREDAKLVASRRLRRFHRYA